MRLIYTIYDYAISELSWKFVESKWNPCWFIVLTISSGTDYVPNKHEDVDPCDPYAKPSEIIPMLKPSWKFGESKWNHYWLIALTSSTGTNYVLNEHEDVD